MKMISTEKATKPTVFFVGGMDHNIPKPVFEHYEVVGHLIQGKSNRTIKIPKVDYVFILLDFIDHHRTEFFREHAKAAGIPVITFKRGWGSLYENLARLGHLPESLKPKPAAPKPEKIAEVLGVAPRAVMEQAVIGLPKDELWARYGKQAVEAVQTVLTPRDRVYREDVVELLVAEVGLPKQDAETLLPELAMRGVLQFDNGHVSLPNFDDDDTPPAAVEPPKPKRVQNNRSKLPHLEYVVLMGGLPAGPYTSKASLANEIDRYQEFQNKHGKPFARDTTMKRIELAVEMGVVKELNDNQVMIERDPSITLHMK